MPNTTVSHISTNPEICGGKPCIAGTRVRVIDIVALHEHIGESADAIVGHYPHISLADVYAALAYYYDHREALDEAMREDRRVFEEYRRKSPSILREKLGLG